jgi:uncharacterized YccA/Bax inhibitor family protein
MSALIQGYVVGCVIMLFGFLLCMYLDRDKHTLTRGDRIQIMLSIFVTYMLAYELWAD